MAKLAAIIPRPTINLVLYHGVLAPHARWRSQAVSYGHPARDGNAREFEASPRAADPTRAWTWPALMRRVFDLDVLACLRCGGRLRVIATVLDPLAVRAILAHRARSGAPRAARPRPTRVRRTHVARGAAPRWTLPLLRARHPPRARRRTPPPAS
jgi:hypothetical protein